MTTTTKTTSTTIKCERDLLGDGYGVSINGEHCFDVYQDYAGTNKLFWYVVGRGHSTFFHRKHEALAYIRQMVEEQGAEAVIATHS